MPEAEKFYITTPIYYVNARPHLGTAYSTIVTDVIARRKRAQGAHVFFLTGTDEHGQKIQRSAKAQGKTPQQFTDEVSGEFRALWKRLDLSNDDFIRTTEPRHKLGVQRLFSLLKERGFIYKGTYTGQYCVHDEAYVDGPPGTRCPDCGRLTETVSEENYYFKLSAFERPLLELYEREPNFIRPETRRNEVMAFVRSGLRDLSISRTSFDWGIPVPGDEKHVIYVWMDALANYITAMGWGGDDPADTSRFAKYWPADLHVIGKEISRFHCVYWPAFLMAAGLPLPKSVFAHGWLLFDHTKMSKSLGNIVRAETILEVLGADALRYFLLRETVFGQDGSFTFDALVQRYNADLANGYGNLVSRTLNMITRYFEGVVPAASSNAPVRQAAESAIAAYNERFDALELSRALEALWALVARADGYISETAPWKVAASTDPADGEKLAEILYTSAEVIRIITALAHPVLPEATSRIWAQLGLGDIAKADLTHIAWGGLAAGTRLGELSPVFPRAEKDAIERMQDIETTNAQKASPSATETGKRHPEDAPTTSPEAPPKTSNLPFASPAVNTAQMPAHSAAAASEHTTLASAIPAAAAAPPAAVTAPVSSPAPSASDGKITIDDFAKVELRVAKVLVAERVPKADKLLRLEVDLGYEQRQILAGIAESYAPESLVGRKVVIVANLAPRKLRGLESNGMIVAASVEGGKAVLAGFLEEIEIGARLEVDVLVDSHAHLDSERYTGELPSILKNAWQAGVRTILSVGIGDGPSTMHRALDLSREFAGRPETPRILATAGIHPHEAAQADDAALAMLEDLLTAPEVIAAGEIGLDYFYDNSPRATQKTVFAKQMEIAAAHKKPIVIHCRPSDHSTNAWDDTLTEIETHWASTGLGGILHCFTGEWDHARRALDCGFLISFAGNVTFPKAQPLRDAAARVPLDRMLVETDAPFLAPVPHRGKRNEPAWVARVAEQIGTVRGIDAAEVAEHTTRNFNRFFHLS